jgi:hypothetical protein
MMAIEARRGCGYRKVGGLYIVGEGSGMPCCKMPIPLHVCPTCNSGIKQTRGWSWIDPQPWLKGDCADKLVVAGLKVQTCPLACPGALGDKVGLLWIGEKFYPTPEHFGREANALGISRRITTVPRGFKVGVHWVFLAHPKVIRSVHPETSEEVMQPAVFRVFQPSRIEKIITQTMSENKELMDDLVERGITPVIVPDNDKDHQGTVYEDDSTELPLQLV